MTATHEADLVVIGYGAAGAAAALRAAELGASVVLLEKQAADAHTPSTRMSGGHVMLVNDAEQGTAYLDRCAGGMVPRAVTAAWAERATTLIEWLDAQGTDFRFQRAYGAEHPEFDGADSIDVCMQARLRDGTLLDFAAGDSSSAEAQGVVRPHRHPEIRAGNEFWAELAAAVQRRPGVELLWETPGHSLIQDETGRVAGVETVDGRRISARHGVVLASGGYEYDDDLKLNYLKAYPTYFYGNPGNTGDGVRMAQAVGADLWHMNQMIGRAIGHFEFEDGGELNIPVVMAPGGYVLVDRSGRRFVNEALQAAGRHDFYFELLVYESEQGWYPRIPCYWVFDAKRLSKPLPNPLTGATVVGLYDWSVDNQREIDRGWIPVGDTVEEAAERAGLDPAAVAASVAEYNDACARGSDTRGRPRGSLIPLDTPPFACVPLYPGGSNSSGGPRRNERAEIVNPFGKPVPGLYGAGELGQTIGLLYPAGGCNISEALCFGQIAVESALHR